MSQTASVLLQPSLQTRVVLDNDEPQLLGVAREDVSDEELKRLDILVTSGVTREGEVTVRRNRSHTVGQLQFRDQTIVVPPAVTGPSFLILLLTSLDTRSLSLTKFIRQMESDVGLAPEEWSSYFDLLLAHLYVRWTEELVASHIAQSYVRQEERLAVLKGKPLWHKNMGRHPVEGVYSSYFQQQTDNIFNQLVLAGLVKASSLLRGTEWDEGVQNQLFIWHTLARVTYPRPDSFSLAYGKISRLTEHYRPVLRLGEALLFGHAPSDLFSAGAQWLQGFYFSMPRLYEKFLGNLLQEVLAPYGLTVREQLAQTGAFVDALDRPYRRVLPDIVIFRGPMPIAVIDAKFKPKYVQGGGRPEWANKNKVSNEDLYQMFFYQARLRYAYGLTESLPAALVSPQLRAEDPPAAKELRTIRWKAADSGDVHGVEVLSVPLEAVLAKLGAGASAGEAIREAPELVEFLQRVI